MFIARDAENHGFQLQACSNRETLGYHVHFLPNHLTVASATLLDTITGQA
jgi:predicted Zn-dependent peptidase